MLITKRSILSGKINEREIPVTQEQLDAWKVGELIQFALPHLSSDDREFLMNGITPEEWDDAWGDDYGNEYYD